MAHVIPSRLAWMDFNKQIGKSRGDVGIWHETYQARAGEYETVYSGMPPFAGARSPQPAGNTLPGGGPR